MKTRWENSFRKIADGSATFALVALIAAGSLTFITGSAAASLPTALGHTVPKRCTSPSGGLVPDVYVAVMEGEHVEWSKVDAEPAANIRATIQRGQAASHLVESHLSIVVRPVSSLLRLLSMVTHTSLEALRPTTRVEIPSGGLPLKKRGKGMDLEKWEKDLNLITRTRSYPGTIEPLIDGEEFFPRLEEAVAGAEKSIRMQTYIFDNDDYALEFARLLKEKSGEVSVRVIWDGMGTIMARGVDHESQPADHAPPRSLAAFLEEDSEVRVRSLPNPWFTLDHSKSTIVDERTAFLGGMNVGREYRHVWHDMMFQVEGPVVDHLREQFDRNWDYAGPLGDLALLTSYSKPGRDVSDSRHYPIRVLKTGTGRSQIYGAHMAAIRRAESYIYIENPYISDDAVLHELIMARRRGVDVRVIMPLECNWKIMARSNVLAANEMLENGIMVYLYPGMSHVKAAVIDGWACIGSANLDKASLRLNREMNLATSHPEAVSNIVTRLFEKDFEASILLTERYEEKWADKLHEIVADLVM